LRCAIRAAALPLEAAGTKFLQGRHDMKVREVIRLIEADGWFVVATRGSHRQYKHPAKAGRVTVAGNRRTIWRLAL
jgi:predicted RNA binding protein YcfA (HicA-like mRNA interferase family)